MIFLLSSIFLMDLLKNHKKCQKSKRGTDWQTNRQTDNDLHTYDGDNEHDAK